MNKLKVLLGTKKFFQIFLSALWNLIFNLIFYQIPASEVIEDQNFASEDKTALLCVRMLKQFLKSYVLFHLQQILCTQTKNKKSVQLWFRKINSLSHEASFWQKSQVRTWWQYIVKCAKHWKQIWLLMQNLLGVPEGNTIKIHIYIYTHTHTV